jgi:transcriptional antiterminator NusG
MGGPLTDFQGLISEISPETSRVKVLVSIFGRETPTDVGFEQLEKA